VLKTIGSSWKPEDRDALNETVRGDPRILVMASAAAVVAWQVSAALALAPPNSVSEALVAVRAAPQASTSEAAAVVRVRAVRYSSCRAAA
jgi:hypothetical protein